ncbi:YraN family protein [Nocardioides malaquae]|nr:YraN family protein [Nocardioides malaquae]
MEGRSTTDPRPGEQPAMRASDALGEYGERVAARHLTAAGLEVLDRNWRCELGEIDLVLREGATLVVCEVKTRSSTAYGTPHEAVTQEKAARLRRLAARWMVTTGTRPTDVRFDLVAVVQARRGAPVVDHVRGAF